MNKYRKKPVVIEAVQWDGSIDVARRIESWSGDKVHLAYTEMRIKTLEGEMEVKPTDWVIRGIKGEFYPCKPDIFEATYDKVAL